MPSYVLQILYFRHGITLHPAEFKIPVPKSETCGISDSNILKLIATLLDSFEHGLCNP